MTSGRQRRRELQEARKEKARQEALARADAVRTRQRAQGAPVNRELLAKVNSYGAPDWLERGYYLDTPFKCVGCGVDEVWTATQQKWWYEVAKGFWYSHAIRCRACRKKQREKKEDARRRSGHAPK
jgi:hypothetical protein